MTTTESLENARPLLACLRAGPVRTPIPVLPALHRGDVVEIQGPASSGKTHLLYHILLSFLVPLVPSPHPEIPAAVVYDTDAAFDIQRFRHLLLSRISRLPSNTLNRHESVRRALARLHVFRPTTLAQLAASIANLPAYHSSRMLNQEIAVLAIDSISAFYWPDRLATEQLRNITPAKDKRVPMVPSLYHVLDAVQGVQRSHRPLVVLTNRGLSRSESLYQRHLYPFPVVEHGDRTTDLGAKMSDSADHFFSFPFHLAYHVALSSPSPDPSAPSDGPLLRDARQNKPPIDSGKVHCLTKSRTGDAASFTFQITDDDTLIQYSIPATQHHLE